MADERRRYYRIEDEVLLSMQLIEQTDIDDRLEDFWANEHAFSIRNNYNFQIEQHISDRVGRANNRVQLLPGLSRDHGGDPQGDGVSRLGSGRGGIPF